MRSIKGIKFFASLVFLFFIVSACSVLAFGQNPVDKSAEKPKPVPAVTISSQANVDETFELNIDERRFTKTDFEASTDVDTGGDARGVNVRIGVSLTAGRIEVLLRNVHGNVRFRGTLDRILEVIGRRPSAAPEVPLVFTSACSDGLDLTTYPLWVLNYCLN